MILREINNVQFLIDWKNKSEGTDLEIDQDFNEENSPIDVKVLSKSKGKVYNFQNVAYRDGNFYKYGQSNIPGFKPLMVLGIAMSPEQRKQSIIECIKGKENKYPASVVRDIILLVEITIPTVLPEELDTLFDKRLETEFQGVYFVKLPVEMPSLNDKYDMHGFVYPLKEAINL